MSEKSGMIKKIFAGVATAVLTAAILSYLGLSIKKQPTYQPPSQPEIQPPYQPPYQPPSKPEIQPPYKPEIQPPYQPPYIEPADFSGRWQTAEGVIYEIEQTGQSFKITEYFEMPLVGYMPSLVGQGTIKGRNAQFSFYNMMEMVSSASIQISPDGSQLTIITAPNLFGGQQTINAYR